MASRIQPPLGEDSTSLQSEIDGVDVIGVWDWDIVRNLVQADALVAKIFDVDPDLAADGVALSAFTDGIHAEDRDRIVQLIEETARNGGMYVAEYRVCSSDNVERWLLARGRFYLDSVGHPVRGRGIVIDITEARKDDKNGMYFYSPEDVQKKSIEQLAAHCVAARAAAGGVGNSTIDTLIKVLLLEVGRELARDLTVERGKNMH